MAFLGHMVSKEGIMVDPRKVEASQKLPRPTTVMKIHSFLDYYRRFVKDFFLKSLPF